MPSEAKRTSELPTSSSLAANARLVALSGSNTVTVELRYLTGNSSLLQVVSTPLSSSSTSVPAGALLTDGSYLYVATATDTLKRVALSTF